MATMNDAVTRIVFIFPPCVLKPNSPKSDGHWRPVFPRSADFQIGANHPGQTNAPIWKSALRLWKSLRFRAIRRRDAIQVAFAAQEKLVAHDRGRSIEAVVQFVRGQDFNLAALLEHHGGAITADNVQSAGGDHGRGIQRSEEHTS